MRESGGPRRFRVGGSGPALTRANSDRMLTIWSSCRREGDGPNSGPEARPSGLAWTVRLDEGSFIAGGRFGDLRNTGGPRLRSQGQGDPAEEQLAGRDREGGEIRRGGGMALQCGGRRKPMEGRYGACD